MIALRCMLVITLGLFFAARAYPGDMTGVGARALLGQNNINLDQLTRSGHKLLLGDLTGVGKSIPLDKITHYLTEKDVLTEELIEAIQIKNNERYHPRVDNHSDFKFGDVIKIEGTHKDIKKELIKGLIVK